MEDKQLLDSYILEGLAMTPPLKGYGLELVWFAQQEKDAFKRLFLERQFNSMDEIFESIGHVDEVLYAAQESFHITEDEARFLHANLFPVAFAMCVSTAVCGVTYTPEQISATLGRVCRNTMLGLRIGRDTGENLVPGKNVVLPISADKYIDQGLDSVRNRNVDRLLAVLIDQDKLVSSLRVNPRYLKDSDWIALEKLLNKVYNDFTSFLKDKYAGLTAAELRLCMLLKLDFPIRSMSLMLGISPTSVTKSKQRLRARFGGESPEETVHTI